MNKKVGKGLASAIDSGEKVAKSAKETLGKCMTRDRVITELSNRICKKQGERKGKRES
jgi:hypothetical protein